jgi:hypothetical protein
MKLFEKVGDRVKEFDLLQRPLLTLSRPLVSQIFDIPKVLFEVIGDVSWNPGQTSV